MIKKKIKGGIKTKKYIRNDGREDKRRNTNKEIALRMMEEKMKKIANKEIQKQLCKRR